MVGRMEPRTLHLGELVLQQEPRHDEANGGRLHYIDCHGKSERNHQVQMRTRPGRIVQQLQVGGREDDACAMRAHYATLHQQHKHGAANDAHDDKHHSGLHQRAHHVLVGEPTLAVGHLCVFTNV